ncbi:Ankyrin repeat protein [Pseudozyma hubeiensis]|nr:Ankyrin repeat protein [Pseudozyma hubeiensis]
MLRNAVSRTTLKAVGQGGLGGSSSHADGMHPNLGLHSAAATGNIGLVKFALENGQPPNSNLNGILPLHAACSGGSEQSVRMLILHGADVNAPRLRAKGSTAGPGAEGSTPLHFAAANGHLEIVRILLEAGARPAAADKEGLTPEALALGAGHIECANLVRSWISAYGSNGLAGMVESRETVSGDVTLGPAGYIRYAASGRSASPLPSTAAASVATSTPALSSTPQAAVPHSATKSSNAPSTSLLTTQSSFDTLPTNKSGSLSKTSSNPNLRNQASSAATPPLPVASPASHSVCLPPQSASTSASASASAIVTPAAAATSPRLTTFPSTQQPYEPVSVAAAIGSGSVRESKRRPSLPSILEKAAHPAASLRAALASGSSAHMGSTSFSQASSVRQPDVSYDANSLSPGKRPAKLAGKRSLSNILRKATGSNATGSQQLSAPASQFSGSSYGDTSATGNNYMLSGGAINLDALAKPGRKAGRPFEHQRPLAASSLRGMRRNTAGDSSAEDQGIFTHAPPTPTSLSGSRTEAGASDQRRTLRSTSSSSSLSAARDLFIADSQRRARAGSNERITSSSRLPQRANASLDLLRPIGFLGQSDDPTASRKSMDKYRGATNQNSRIDAIMRAGFGLPSASGSTTSVQQVGASSAAPHLVSRDRSVSGSSSQSAATTDNDGQTVEETADEDDLQEFLDHSASQTGDSTLDGGERRDSHRLPAALRTMTALRQQSSRDAGEPLMTDSAAPIHSLVNAPGALQDGHTNHSSSAPFTRVTRDRSGSHVSAVSSGSQSGNSSRGADFGQRSSPGLAAGYQTMSIAEENGLTLSAGPASTTGASSSSLSRAGRAPSVTESITSHASSSSLRSNFLSAAEQAQAILNHEAPYTSDGPDGTSTSLAAQLAAYGEALAVERKRAGDTRNGPSPALSARGSNAALRSKLPSVSEDQSPSRSASHNSRSFSLSEQRIPNLPATAAQSYNRRVSRRPHSSEGQQDAAKRGTFGPPSVTIGPSTLSATDKARLGLDRSPASSQGHDKAAAHDARGVSPHTIDGRREGSPLPQLTAQAPAEIAAEPDRSDRLAAAMLTRDQPRRLHEPVMLSSSSVQPLDVATTPNSYATDAAGIDDDDEDDPKTPVLGGSRATMDKFATSPRNLHQHSPSLPTQLESYNTARLERLPDAVSAGGSGADSSTGSAAPPRPPPRKESIHPSGLGLDNPSISSDNRTLTPDSAKWETWRAEDGMAGRGDNSTQEKPTRSTSSSRWEGLRRPSLNMLRSATSSSTNSQAPSHTSFSGSTEDHGHSRRSTEDSMVVDRAEQQPASGGSSSKRRLVRNLLNKAKGTS